MTGRRFELLAEQPVPRLRGVAAKASGEQQLRVIVVSAEHPVIQSLAVVGVRTRGQQQPGGIQGGGQPDARIVPGVGLVQQRRPAVRAGGAGGRRRVSFQEPADLGDIRAGSGHREAERREFGVLGEQASRGRVLRAGQPEEPVG
jgi:hypothetical protein